MWVMPADAPEAEAKENSTKAIETEDLATCATPQRATKPRLDSGCVWDSLSSIGGMSGGVTIGGG